MRITLTNGDRAVDIRIPGAGVGSLRRVENAALRMIAALPAPAPAPAGEEEEQTFGFGVSSDTERSEPPPLREHDIEQYDDPDLRRLNP